ncbi:hypothetical protein ACIQOW_32820 [Kitasatospora sp. NPDC091335]|uniref:hypothetical protein n=1 Tax=Kitasatospora sp. NPDC091335 TaxID=3364085 RepID=UPI0038163BBB
MTAWEVDAELFGKASSKAFLALLAARCVELSGTSAHVSSDMKVSAETFAQGAGRSRNTVKAYVRTWDLLAKDGHVPPRTELVPGMDVELPAAKAWTEYYRRANPPKAKKTDGVTLEQAEAAISDEPPGTVLPVPQGRRVETYVTRMFEATEDIEDRIPGPAGDAVGRLVEALAALRDPVQTNRAYLHSLDAVAELVAALGTP